ncbi:MAG TPA: calcium/sodium antiporter [Longimicrobiales bacterium]
MPLASWLLVLLGFALLIAAADLVVRGASSLARAAGVAPLVVGLTVVAFGTSAPEVAVSIKAALAGQEGLALGNVVGSNVFNVLLVLGISALIVPLSVQPQLVRFDVPVLIAVSALPLLMALDGVLARWEGVVLIALAVVYTTVLIFTGRRPRDAMREAATDSREASSASAGLARNVARVVVGCVGLVLGADLLVKGATDIARTLGVSNVVIGITLVAAGTSLPELATSVVASLRGERDLAVGNVVGSNIFNTLVVLGAAATVASGGMDIPRGVLTFDLPVMLAVAVTCLLFFFSDWTVSRAEGMVFLAYYALFILYLTLDASDHEARNLARSAVLSLVPMATLLGLLSWWNGRSDTRPPPPPPPDPAPSGAGDLPR